MDEVDTILAHYGVKGMKWGKRNKDNSPTAVTVQANPGKKLKTAGGANQDASPDAVKAAVGKQTAKKSGVQSLSNAELKSVVERMNLEQQYSRLSAGDQTPVQKGANFAKTVLLGAGKQQATAYANNQVAEMLKK